MTTSHCFAFLADLHLSDRTDTAAHNMLCWSVDWLNQRRPDFVAVGGDMITYGTATSTAHLLAALGELRSPVLLTPGNAELRRDAATPLLREWTRPERRFVAHGDLLALLPDTSTGSLSQAEREWMQQVVGDHPEVGRLIVLTHYSVDTLDQESRAWLLPWLAREGVELVVAGHRHLSRTRSLDGCEEIVVRGMDPDKAMGDLPGISFLESSRPGQWTESHVPWSPDIELMPADLPAGISPVGWSIHADPVDAARQTLESDLCCLELRPRDLAFSRPALARALEELRDDRSLFLSYHLPSLARDPESGQIEGREAFAAHVEVALGAGVDSLTVHVPVAPARYMEEAGDGACVPTQLYREFAGVTAELLIEAARAGVRIAIENLHNPRGTPVGSPDLCFATVIDQYLRWIDAMGAQLAGAPNAVVGVHLDVGHARNNGGELDNLQPLGDWCARLGRRILGYHIHQVQPDLDAGGLANHKGIDNLFGGRISFAGFLWAWSTRQITRGPLFVEVRDDEARRQTAQHLQRLFERAGEIGQATDLPDRAG